MSGTFEECTGLTSVVIPANVTKLGMTAFGFCTNLHTVTFVGDVPADFHPLAFDSTTATVYYPGDNETWSDGFFSRYFGGELTWVPYYHYEITEGADGVWTQGSTDGLSFRASGSYAKLTQVQVDGVAISEGNEVSGEDTTVVSLSPEFLADLSLGEHTLTVVYTDGEASAVFTVKAAEPEVTEPEVTEPEVTEPEVTEPEVTEPEVTEPEVTEPEVTEPETTEPEVTEPEVTEPETTEPETTEPEATEPETTEPEATEPEVTEPETTEPETTVPEQTEPEETKPADTENPTTGDTAMFVVILMVLTAGMAAALVTSKKRIFK